MPPTDEQLAFWSAIRANPEDDTARLVYSDWLEDHGQPIRGQFIRAQVTAARLDDLDPTRIRLDRPAADLLARNEKAWLTPVRRIAHSCVMDRGFPRHVVVNSRKFREKGKGLLALEPIWSVRPTALRTDAANLAGLMAGLEGIRELSLMFLNGMSTTLRIREWQTIFTHPTLESVHTLVLENNAIPNASWKTIFETPQLRNIRRLVVRQDLSGGSRHLATIPDPPIFRSLQELHFNDCSMNISGAWAAWVDRLPWSQMTQVTMPQGGLEAAGAFPANNLRAFHFLGGLDAPEVSARFLKGTVWPMLERLDLESITATVLPVLAEAAFPRLRALTFQINRPTTWFPISDADLAESLHAWTESALLGQLEELTVCWEVGSSWDTRTGSMVYPPMAPQLLEAMLARSTPLQLRKLVLRSAVFTLETLQALMSSGLLPELEGITFDDCVFPELGLQTIAKTSLPKLRAIGLSRHSAQGDLSPLVGRFGEYGVRTVGW